MDEELDLVTFSDEDGNEFTMEVLDYFFYEGKEYALLAEVEDDCECDACDHDDDCDCGCEEREAYIMEVVPVGDDEEEFVPVDEELAERLIEMVENQLYDDEDEDDEAIYHLISPLIPESSFRRSYLRFFNLFLFVLVG